DRFAQNPIDLGLGGGIELPTRQFVDRLQLIGMTRAPQRRGDALVEYPADRQMNDAFAETILGETIELLHGGEILCEPRLAELRIGAAKIIAVEFAVRSHASGQQPPAQSSVDEGRDLVLAAIGQQVGLDCALE